MATLFSVQPKRCNVKPKPTGTSYYVGRLSIQEVPVQSVVNVVDSLVVSALHGRTTVSGGRA